MMAVGAYSYGRRGLALSRKQVMRMDPSLRNNTKATAAAAKRTRPTTANSNGNGDNDGKESTSTSVVSSRAVSRQQSRPPTAFSFSPESLAQLKSESAAVASATTPRSARGSPPVSTRHINDEKTSSSAAASTATIVPVVPIVPLTAEEEAARQKRIAHKRSLSMRVQAAIVERKAKEREIKCTDFIFSEQRRARQRKQIKQLCRSISTMTNPDQVRAVRQEYRGTSLDYVTFAVPLTHEKHRRAAAEKDARKRRVIGLILRMMNLSRRKEQIRYMTHEDRVQHLCDLLLPLVRDWRMRRRARLAGIIYL